MKYILSSLLTFSTLIACTEQRDLYVSTSPLFVVKADWSRSTLSPHGATALVYNSEKAILPNPFMQPPTSTQGQRVAPGTYDILVFNNLMLSPIENEFTDIFFKGTDHFDTFEALAALNSKANSLFRAAAQEVIVNNPDMMAAAAYRQKNIVEHKDYAMKYQNGNKTGNYEGDYINDSVKVTPVRLTRKVQIVVRAKNYKQKFAVYGTLRGFAQGVNLSTRKPTGSSATHAGFLINKATPDPTLADHHILTSDEFTSFGPWWDDPLNSNTYSLDILARYNGQGDVFNYSFNVTKLIAGAVTKSVEQAITTIKAEESAYSTNGTIPEMKTIVIEVWIELPEVFGEDEGMDVGVDDWGEVVIVDVPIRF